MTYNESLKDALNKNPFLQLSHIVYQVLKKDIITLKLKPDTKLNLTELAEQFGTSRTPVREALRLLIEENFIQQQPGKKGFFVCPVPRTQIDKLFDSRKMIEGEAAYLCALNYTNIDFSYPLYLCDQFIKMIDTKDLTDYPENEVAFHKFFIEATNNPLFVKMYEVIETMLFYHSHQIKEYWTNNPDYLVSATGNHSLPMQHIGICNAVVSGVPQIAQEAAINHLRSGRHYMQLYLLPQD